MPKKNSKKIKPLPPIINFVNAGLSGMCATYFVQPMDVLKNRMQMSTKSTTVFKTVKSIVRNEGYFKLYAGLDAGLVRQATYTAPKLGIYNYLQDSYREQYPDDEPNFFVNALISSIAGSAGALIGTPSEVALIRMTSDGRLAPEQRRNYRNVVDAFARIIREEGVSVLWRGSMTTMGRAAIVNVTQLATYSEAKSLIAWKFKLEDDIPLHFYSSMVSGLITAFNSMPLDIAKTRLQNLKASKMPGMLSILYDIVKVEGFRALWKGFWPYYYRLGSHSVFTLVFNEQFAKYYRDNYMK